MISLQHSILKTTNCPVFIQIWIKLDQSLLLFQQIDGMFVSFSTPVANVCGFNHFLAGGRLTIIEIFKIHWHTVWECLLC